MTAHSCVGTEAEHGAQTRLGGAAVQAVVVGGVTLTAQGGSRPVVC